MAKALISLMLVDDQSFIRDAVKDLLKSNDEVEISFEASSGKEALRKLEENSKPDVILMDISMPVMDGITATQLISIRYPLVKILGFTLNDKEPFPSEMIKAGALGIISKTADKKSIVSAILTVAEGKVYVPQT